MDNINRLETVLRYRARLYDALAYNDLEKIERLISELRYIYSHSERENVSRAADRMLSDASDIARRMFNEKIGVS